VEITIQEGVLKRLEAQERVYCNTGYDFEMKNEVTTEDQMNCINEKKVSRARRGRKNRGRAMKRRGALSRGLYGKGHNENRQHCAS